MHFDCTNIFSKNIVVCFSVYFNIFMLDRIRRHFEFFYIMYHEILVISYFPRVIHLEFLCLYLLYFLDLHDKCLL